MGGLGYGSCGMVSWFMVGLGSCGLACHGSCGKAVMFWFGWADAAWHGAIRSGSARLGMLRQSRCCWVRFSKVGFGVAVGARQVKVR